MAFKPCLVLVALSASVLADDPRTKADIEKQLQTMEKDLAQTAADLTKKVAALGKDKNKREAAAVAKDYVRMVNATQSALNDRNRLPATAKEEAKKKASDKVAAATKEMDALGDKLSEAAPNEGDEIVKLARNKIALVVQIKTVKDDLAAKK